MEVLEIDIPFEYRFKCWFCGEDSHTYIEVNHSEINGGLSLISIPTCDECQSYGCHLSVITLDELRPLIKDKIIIRSSKELSIGANWTEKELTESDFTGNAFEGFKRSGWEMFLIAKERVNFKAWDLCIDGIPISEVVNEEIFEFDGLTFSNFNSMLDYLSKTFFLDKPFLKRVLTLYGNDRTIEAVKFCRLVPHETETEREIAFEDLVESFREKDALALNNKILDKLVLYVDIDSIVPVQLKNNTIPALSIQWAMQNGVINFETLDRLEDNFFDTFSSEGDEKAFQLFNALEIYLDKRLSSLSWRKNQDPNFALWEYVESQCKLIRTRGNK
ncbi:hypothetical protein [Colwellia polaris]|jgi:hypothetical protein|uniref:hypothetical protein n=1 Tax=Colwellia polaris TaxID=326537 RepID=UPI000A16DDF9|nr:hypothetical protein [Colwellia polaris]|tara:strand:- start:1345 stop:2340 length:996 start_codon:yes stop_codon:yes gene_type:complete